MTDKTYNGWTNYATWRVNLELFDGADPLHHCAFCESVHDLARSLNAYADEIINEYPDGLAKDYALAFLSDVNWHEIANRMADDHELFSTEDVA